MMNFPGWISGLRASVLRGRLDNLAVLLGEAKRYDEAEPLFSRAIEVLEEALGPDHSTVADSLEHYAVMLRAAERQDDAVMLEARAKSIRERE